MSMTLLKPLTAKEREIMELVAKGLNRTEISDELKKRGRQIRPAGVDQVIQDVVDRKIPNPNQKRPRLAVMDWWHDAHR